LNHRFSFQPQPRQREVRTQFVLASGNTAPREQNAPYDTRVIPAATSRRITRREDELKFVPHVAAAAVEKRSDVQALSRRLLVGGAATGAVVGCGGGV